MARLKPNYDPNNPVDVRQFSQDIARMCGSGPAGSNQAGREIGKLAQTAKGRQLLEKARMRARIESHFAKADLSGGKAHSGGSSPSLGAQAFSSGSSVSLASNEPGKGLIAHELSHVVQQSAAKGKK